MEDTASTNLEAAVEACSNCYQTCLRTAMNHCLPAGGRHVETEHFRLMMNCVEICKTSVNFHLSSSTFTKKLCDLCAEICDACAKSCEDIGGMNDCVIACREGAKKCRQMDRSEESRVGEVGGRSVESA